jgi:hypothetical protein
LDFITNFIYKVYNKHPFGRSLVYFYRLLYRPTARVDHPHGPAVQSKGVEATGVWLVETTGVDRPSPAIDAPDNSLVDLSDPGWLRGVAVPKRLMSPITIDDRSSKPT